MFLPLKNEKYFYRISNNLPTSFQDILVDRAESWELQQTPPPRHHPVSSDIDCLLPQFYPSWFTNV